MINFLENQTGVTVKLIQKDKDREFLGDLKTFIEKKGIEIWNTCTGESLQNGIVERTHETLWKLVKACLLAAKLPAEFWEECILYVVYCVNRTPKSFLNGMTTPYEIMNKGKPNLHNIHPFGSLCYLYIDKLNRESRPSPNSIPAVFVGYPANEKGFRVYNPISATYHQTIHISFPPKQIYYTQKYSIYPNAPTPAFQPNHLSENVLQSLMILSVEANAPKGYKSALASPQAKEWKNAIQNEVDSFFANKTGDYVDYKKIRSF